MADIGRILRTVRHLRCPQMVYQVAYRMHKPVYQQLNAPEGKRGKFYSDWTAKPTSLLKSGRFVFLNLEGPADWNFVDNGMLWAYNMNYMDWLHQKDISDEEQVQWIEKFINELPNCKIALDPYPIALRCINWVKVLVRNKSISLSQRQEIEDNLWSQVKLLERKLEYHLLGNHLLEDAYALFISSVYFRDDKMMMFSRRLLCRELQEQILNDGCHYEQSPMYQCVLLDRLLDCYNIALANAGFVDNDTMGVLKTCSESMLSWLQTIIYRDGSIPMMNDSAKGIAPTPQELFDYGHRLGLKWTSAQLSDSGYRKMQAKRLEAVVDIGNITATYQPGHSHADTFNYELRVDGKPFIVDTGITTYNKNDRRQYERSTMAHNTVTVDGLDSSEVWGGFRVGRRAKVKVQADETGFAKAVHDGFGKDCLHERSFRLEDNSFVVEDHIGGDHKAVNYIHFESGLEPSVKGKVVDCGNVEIRIEGADNIEIKDNFVASEYNRLRQSKFLAVSFKDSMKYSINVMR